MRGMTFREGQKDAMRYRATVARIGQQAAGAREATLVQNLPCTVGPVSRESSFRDAFESATHVLTTYAPRPLIQAGDTLTSLIGPDGLDYVRPGKPWQVVGRRHFHGGGDIDHTTIFLSEPV